MSACDCGGAKCSLAAGDERHATLPGYRQGCRCTGCREANAAKARDRRHAKGLVRISPLEAANLRKQGLKRCPKCEETKPVESFGATTQPYCRACRNKTNRRHQPKDEVAALREQGLKRCTKCGEVRPREAFGANASASDGLGSRCRECRSSGARRRVWELREQGLKKCLRCRAVKEFDDFARKASARDGRQPLCRPCQKEYASMPERREAQRSYAARYYAENPEKERERGERYRRENADRIRESQARYRSTAEGKAAWRAASQRRRERKRNRYCGCDTRENLHAVWVMDGGLCAYCGAEGTDYEHVVPLARGGWGCISNFRIACKSCNSKKGTKPLSVFLERLAASGVDIRPGATNSGLPCPAAAARMAARMLQAGSA